VPDGYPIVPWGVSSLTVTSADEARRTASQLLEDGADVIKIPLESGPVFQRQLPVLSPEEAAAIVEVAHQRGTRVSAHVTVAVDLERALQAGVDDIAHMVVDAPSAEVIQRIVKAGIYWVPTIELWKRVGQGQDAHVLENLRQFVEAGGKVALGTDYDGYDAVFDLGMPIHEILWMQEAGMTPMEIIVAGTRSAAYVCNLEKVLGTLEPGKIADILVVNGNPLDDLNALTKVQLVIHAGEVIVNGSGE
jgi:imidazolonepropionase-like amidohydrolase